MLVLYAHSASNVDLLWLSTVATLRGSISFCRDTLGFPSGFLRVGVDGILVCPVHTSHRARLRAEGLVLREPNRSVPFEKVSILLLSNSMLPTRTSVDSVPRVTEESKTPLVVCVNCR